MNHLGGAHIRANRHKKREHIRKVRESGVDLRVIEAIPNRCLKVLKLVSNGYELPEVAKQLGLSRSTVKEYLSRARMGLYALNTAHAVKIALQRGMI